MSGSAGPPTSRRCSASTRVSLATPCSVTWRPGTRPVPLRTRRDYPARAGKSIRPCICSRLPAFGGSSTQALPAVAIELLHNAFLVHDDIEDESEMRRGRPRSIRCTASRLPSTPATPCFCSACVRCSTTRHSVRNSRSSAARYRADGARDRKGKRWSSAGGATTSWTSRTRTISAGVEEDIVARRHLPHARRRHDRNPRPGRSRRRPLRLFPRRRVPDPGRPSQSRRRPPYGKEALGDLLEGKRTLMLIHLLGHASVGERRSLVAFLARAGGHPDAPHDGAPDIDAERVLEGLMVHHGSLELLLSIRPGRSHRRL